MGRASYILLVIFICSSLGNVLDDYPYDDPHFPNHPIDWSNIVFGNVSVECLAQLKKMTGSGANESYVQMKMASGHTLGDVGKWWNCTQIPIAQYCFTSLDKANCALSVPICNIGLCVPAVCSPSDVENVARQIYFDKRDRSLNVTAHCGNDYSTDDWIGFSFAICLLLTVATILIVGTIMWLISTGDIKQLFIRAPQTVVISSPLTIEPEKEREIVDANNSINNEPSIEMDERGIDNDKKDEDELVGYVMEDGILGENGHVVASVSNTEAIFDRLALIIPKESLFVKIWKSFAINYNFGRLLSPIPGEFGALNGLRFFNMLWIIWGHTLFFWIYIGSDNLYFTYAHALHVFWMQTPINGVLGVDSFFFLSGFLVTYFLYERLISGKKMQWFLFYFHRFWRIIPMYLFVMLLYIFLTPFLGSGPFWYEFREGVVSRTAPYCWSNLFFINNFYPNDPSNQCMGWGWFLAVDMQFYILSPFLILLQYYLPVAGTFGLIAAALVDIISSFSISYIDQLSPSIIKHQPDFFDYYQKPYCRISPFVVGMASAYIYSYIKRKRPNFKIPSVLLNVGYLVSFITIFCVVYFIYYVDKPWMYQWEESLYFAFGRLFFATAIAYLMLTFFLGYGGILRIFFCLRVWQPLAKLTFGAYLVHPIVMMLVYFNQWEYIMFTYRNVWYFYFGHLFVSFSLSALLYLAIEKPTMNIEPFIIGGMIKLYYRVRGKEAPSKLSLEDM